MHHSRHGISYTAQLFYPSILPEIKEAGQATKLWIYE